MAEITEDQRIAFLQSLPEIKTWLAYGPDLSWSGEYRSFRGVDIDFSRGLMPFFKKYQTHLMGDGDRFIGATYADYTDQEIRERIDLSMEMEKKA